MGVDFSMCEKWTEVDERSPERTLRCFPPGPRYRRRSEAEKRESRNAKWLIPTGQRSNTKHPKRTNPSQMRGKQKGTWKSFGTKTTWDGGMCSNTQGEETQVKHISNHPRQDRSHLPPALIVPDVLDFVKDIGFLLIINVFSRAPYGEHVKLQDVLWFFSRNWLRLWLKLSEPEWKHSCVAAFKPHKH